MSEEKTPGTSEAEPQGRTFEVTCGIVNALLAAILAVTDLGAGKFGDDELIAHNQKNNGVLGLGGSFIAYSRAFAIAS